MIGKFKKYRAIALAIMVIGSANVLGSSFDKKEIKAALVEIAQRIVDSGAKDRVLSKFTSKPPKDEDAMLKMCKQIKKHRDILSKNELKAIDEIKDEIKTYLKGFIAKGAGACVDPNLGLCWDTMNPTITVNFVNPKGEVKTRRHQFLINSIGIKFVCSVDICCIRLTGLSFNYYDSNKELNLGSGIDMSACAFGGLNFVYCSIKDMPGCGVVLVSIPVGVAAGLSYVYGGKIVPVK